MTEFEEIRPLLEKVLREIYGDRSKLTYSTSDGGLNGGRITAWRLEQAADNHLFDDHPELFGITKHDGHTLRQYFEEYGEDREYVELLHLEFPQYMDDENRRYLNELNQARVKRGLFSFKL